MLPRRPPHSPRRILIIRFSSLGDVLLTSPVIRQLRQHHPEAEIDFLVRREYADLVRYNPHLSTTIEFDATSGSKGLQQLKSHLRDRGYDVILDLHRSLRSRYLCLGYRRGRVLSVRKHVVLRFLLVHFKINLYRRRFSHPPSVPEKYLRAAAPLGVDIRDTAPELYLPEAVQQAGARRWQALSADGFGVIMAPGARHFTKRWPTEAYAALIEKLFRQYGWRTVMVGGPEEREIIRDILRRTEAAGPISLAGDISLLETCALMAQAPLFISNDSGLMHVAAAFRRPQIAIFGSTTRELGFFPRNPRAVVVENTGLSCRPCSHIGRASCPKGHFRCMREITPEQVFRVA
ncbi:MAG: lipopolysaccharide heptosyltransferase II, partial [Calditrichaeota bacterium]